MAKKWTEITHDDLYHLYWVEGHSLVDIAKLYGLKTDESVRKKMIKLGVERRSHGANRTFNPDKEEIERLYQTRSMKQVARYYNVGETVIWKRLREYGITLHGYEDGGHRKKPGRKFSQTHKDNLSNAQRINARTGEANPNWKGGSSSLNLDLRRSSEYRLWKRRVLQRFEGRCNDCGRIKGGSCPCCGLTIPFHVHHIKSFADFPELRFEPSNGEVLCKPCHNKRHDGKIG